jgi:hypothetical protein
MQIFLSHFFVVGRLPLHFMKSNTRIVCLGIWLAFSISSPARSQPAEKLPPLNVSKQKISFDPQTVQVGATGHYLGLMEARVTILARNEIKCTFEYYSIGCGGVSTTQRIEVPIADGPVVFDFSEKATGENSLPKTARVIYSRNYLSGVRALVMNTDEYVEYTLGSPRSDMYPQKGDTVKFHYSVFESAKFDRHLATADFTHKVEFVMGADNMWPWLAQAMEEMSVGDERQIQVPVKASAGAIKWLKEPEQSKMIYATIRLVSIERAKK